MELALKGTLKVNVGRNRKRDARHKSGFVDLGPAYAVVIEVDDVALEDNSKRVIVLAGPYADREAADRYMAEFAARFTDRGLAR